MPVILDSYAGALHPRQDFEATGAIVATTGGTVALGVATPGLTGALQGVGTVLVSLVGTGITGTPTCILEGTIDGSAWQTVPMWTWGTLARVSTLTIPAVGGFYFAKVAGWRALRLRGITAPTAGSYAVTLRASNADTDILAMPSGLLAAPATAAVSNGTTLTLAAPGLGLFHWITRIRFELHASLAMTGAAAPFAMTTTNLPNADAYRFKSAIPVGEKDFIDIAWNSPLRSTVANTATTFVAPVATGGIWFLRAYGYVGP